MAATPEEELAVLISGGKITPSPAENLELHLQSHKLQLVDQVVRQTLGVIGIRKLEQHVFETEQLMRVQLIAQQQKPSKSTPVGRQAANAETGKAAPQPVSPPTSNQAQTSAIGGGGGGVY